MNFSCLKFLLHTDLFILYYGGNPPRGSRAIHSSGSDIKGGRRPIIIMIDLSEARTEAFGLSDPGALMESKQKGRPSHPGDGVGLQYEPGDLNPGGLHQLRDLQVRSFHRGAQLRDQPPKQEHDRPR
ncbi:unnamed protein product [Nezara viridula]|uniref:Uncharacterized protein n=1 Tax=Nezara viridula TaxID=85310 RepID=A0A9P0HLK1_NEZVI|nr:unnamed protein product [Nezara viridula]